MSSILHDASKILASIEEKYSNDKLTLKKAQELIKDLNKILTELGKSLTRLHKARREAYSKIDKSDVQNIIDENREQFHQILLEKALEAVTKTVEFDLPIFIKPLVF